jgi:hypothetical protein
MPESTELIPALLSLLILSSTSENICRAQILTSTSLFVPIGLPLTILI